MVDKYLLDTNFLVHLLDGREDCVNIFKNFIANDAGMYISSVIVCEILSYSKLSVKDITTIKSLLSLFQVIAIDAGIAERAAKIRRQKRIRTPDALIAGSCLCMGLTLVTENLADFEKIEGLKILKI